MINIGIYIYNNAEVLDFSGPFEVFSTANRICGNNCPLNVFLVGETDEGVIARGEYTVIPKYGFYKHPNIDVLVIVGGDHTEEMRKTNVIDWIAKQAKSALFISSVCTGVFLLSKAKVITNQKVTTHWSDIALLKRQFPKLQVLENCRWVEEGNIISSAGISAGIDMSLHLVSKLCDKGVANKTALAMEYNWNKL